MGFGDVLADLAEIGYDAEWQVIPAAAVGALHKRDRVFIVAYPNNARESMTETEANANTRPTTPSGIDGNGSAQIKKRQNVAQSGVSRRGADVA
jgi:DNA (cytosine-5)-methyltransferase 1